MFSVGGGIGRIDKKVVHVDNEPSFCDHIMKEVVHESLKGGRRIGKTKEHYSRFEESFMGNESGLPLVPVFDMDVVIPPMDIKLGENFCSLEFINKIGDEWKGICIADSAFVDIAIVLTRTETAVFLVYKEERGCLWGI